MPIAPPLRILFVLNPVSGKGPKGEIEQTIHQYFKDSPHQTETFELSGTPADATSIRYWTKEWKANYVVAVGGDGTLKAVAEILLRTNIPVGLLPAGSANGMAKELGIPDDYTKCLDIITAGHTRDIDVIRINDKDISLHLSDFGLNAQLVKRFEESDYRGMWGYAREVWKVMRSKQRFRVQVKTKERIFFRYAWMVVIANARMYGTGAVINPEGDLQDGLLEVIILRSLSFTELLKMVIRHRKLNPKKTEVIQVSEVNISLSKAVYFQVDGEYCGSLRELDAKVEHEALKMLLPKPE
jgi:YegS/Rv2252/BmrU family lipid kinase